MAYKDVKQDNLYISSHEVHVLGGSVGVPPPRKILDFRPTETVSDAIYD